MTMPVTRKRYGQAVLWLFSLLLGLTLFGCTLSRLQIGHPLDASSARLVEAGQLTAEVLERLGPPDRVTLILGEPIFEYFYREELDRELELSFFQANFDYEQVWQKADRLVIRFDRDGRVRDYGINLETGASR